MRLMYNDFGYGLVCNQNLLSRDVNTGATGATKVAPKFSDTLTLFQPGGQIQPTISGVAPKFSLWLRPCTVHVDQSIWPINKAKALRVDCPNIYTV